MFSPESYQITICTCLVDYILAQSKERPIFLSCPRLVALVFLDLGVQVVRK